MKKMLVLLLTLLISTTCIRVLAERSTQVAYESGDFGYNLMEDGTAEIGRYYGGDEKLVIPSTLDGITVTTIGYSAFADCYVEQITIPSSVTIIGSGACRESSNLTSTVVGRDSYARQFCIEHNLPYISLND